MKRDIELFIEIAGPDMKKTRADIAGQDIDGLAVLRE